MGCGTCFEKMYRERPVTSGCKKLAPIVLFTYNRPWHTQQTINSLRRNELAAHSDLFVFSDGARNTQASRDGVREVREFLATVDGFNSVRIVERTENFGLADSIISGVTELCNVYGSVIVLEDDMVTSPHFLRFMNDALDMYESDEKVISIHGYVYPVQSTLPDTFFLKGADCWGWATWRRGWALFEKDGSKLLDQLKANNLVNRFNFNGTFDYVHMLRGQIKGKNNSWAVRWYASALLKDRLTLYPGRSLVQNIGIDNSGTHCVSSNDFQTTVSEEPVVLNYVEPEENLYAFNAFQDYFRSIRSSAFRRLMGKLKEVAGW